MPTTRLEDVLSADLDEMAANGTRKGSETAIAKLVPAEEDKGPRYLLTGEGNRLFLRMNSNAISVSRMHLKLSLPKNRLCGTSGPVQGRSAL